MNAWYKHSTPLEEGKYKVFSDKLKQICEFNGIPPPEIRMLEIASAAADSVNNHIYISPMLAEHMVREGSEEQLACIAAHELAHVVLGHDGPQKKKSEYLVDRIGEAFIRDEELYKQSLITQHAFTDEFRQAEKAAHQNIPGLTGIMARFGQYLKQVREESIYGTFDERQANIQYDLDREKIREQALPLAGAAVGGSGEALQKLASQFNLEENTIRGLVAKACEQGTEQYPAENYLASYLSTRAMQGRDGQKR